MQLGRFGSPAIALALAALGAAAGLAMARAWAWPVLWAALAALNAVVARREAARGARLAGSAAILLSLFWMAADPVGSAFANHFAPHPIWRVLAALLVGAFVASWYLPAIWFAVHVSHRAPRVVVPIALGTAIALSEWLRVEAGHVPMALLAYGFTDTPLLRLAPWLGPYGAGALAVAVAGWAVMPGRPHVRHGVSLLAACSLLAIMVSPDGASRDFESSAGTRAAVALRHSAPLEDVGRSTLKARAEAMLATVEAASGDLVVFSETALPMPWELLPASVREKFQALATERRITIVIGAFRQQQQHAFNSAVILEPGKAQPRRWTTPCRLVLGSSCSANISMPSRTRSRTETRPMSRSF